MGCSCCWGERIFCGEWMLWGEWICCGERMSCGGWIVVVNGCPVVSGLAPRWAAKQPHQEHRISSGKSQRQFWGCSAAQRGASPLTTKKTVHHRKPHNYKKTVHHRKPDHHRGPANHGKYGLLCLVNRLSMVSGFVVVNGCPVVSGLAPRWAAKRPHQEHRISSGKSRWQFWGCSAAQRGASPLTTKRPRTTENLTTTKRLCITETLTTTKRPCTTETLTTTKRLCITETCS